MPHYPNILEGIAERNTSLSDQERGHLMDLARLLRYTPTERYAKLNEHSKAHMQALVDLVGIPSRQFKADAMQREWIDREQAMRLVPALRDHGSALAELMRQQLLSSTLGVATSDGVPKQGADAHADGDPPA